MKEMDGGFLVIIFKNILNNEQLRKLGLNERQIKAMLFLKENKKITNKDYQTINNVSERTALRDLDQLVSLDIIKKIGDKKGTYYQL